MFLKYGIRVRKTAIQENERIIKFVRPMFKYSTIRQLLNYLITSCNGWDQKHRLCVFLYLINEAIYHFPLKVNVSSKAFPLPHPFQINKTHTCKTLIAFYNVIWTPWQAHSNIHWWAWRLSSVANLFDLFAASSSFVWVSGAFLIFVGCILQSPNKSSTASLLFAAQVQNSLRTHANRLHIVCICIEYLWYLNV